MNADQVMTRLRACADPSRPAGMARHGINIDRVLGVRIPDTRALAKEIGTSHALAMELWATEIHEARILASMIADRRLATPEFMEAWALDFDSWDLCDQCCMNLFRRTPHAYDLVTAWAARDEEFVRRASFSLLAGLAVADKKAPDERFATLLTLTEQHCGDSRNMVKKAVNWALRQIGKRNSALNALAIETADRIHAQGSPAARWIATDALRELRSDAVQRRLEK